MAHLRATPAFDLFIFLFFFSFSFDHISVIASVNMFDCIRSRCSMDMWCLDDTGQDKCDWVGPLAGGEHDSTPLSEVEGPRLLKRSVTRLDYCCSCC